MIYPIFGQTRIIEIKVFDGTAIGCTAAAVANKRMTMSGKRAPVSAIHPLTDPTVTWRVPGSVEGHPSFQDRPKALGDSRWTSIPVLLFLFPCGLVWSYVFLILDGDIRSSSRYRHCH